MRAAGGTPYIIPEGGSNALGRWGYIARDARARRRPRPSPRRRARPPSSTPAAPAAPAPASSWARSCSTSPSAASGSPASTSATTAPTSSTSIGRICAELTTRWQLPAQRRARRHRARRRPRRRSATRGAGPRSSRRSATCAAATASCSIRSTPARRSTASSPSWRATRRASASVVFIHTGGMFGLFADPATIAPSCSAPEGSARARAPLGGGSPSICRATPRLERVSAATAVGAMNAVSFAELIAPSWPPSGCDEPGTARGCPCGRR